MSALTFRQKSSSHYLIPAAWGAVAVLGLMLLVGGCKANNQPASVPPAAPPPPPPATPAVTPQAPPPAAKPATPAATPQTPPPAAKPATPAAAPQTPPPAAKPAAPTKTDPVTKTKETKSVKQADKTVIKIVTKKGDITAELFDKQEPITAGNFLLLVESGFYNGLTFHRVVPNFVIQGGDPTGTGAGGPGFTIPDEIDPAIKHHRGTLSMAKTMMPNSAGSQFFICTGGPETVGHLDGSYAAFGQVLKGMDVVDKIVKGDKMEKIEVVSLSPYAAAACKAAKQARVKDQ